MAYQKHNFKDGDILKAEHLNCIEDCIAEEPNWNAAEGEPGHVQNRTHWIEPNGVILEESEADAMTDPTFGKVWRIHTAPNLEAGKTYTVVYNGTPFSCACQLDPSGTSDDPNALCMGNFSIAGYPDTGEPFVMLITPIYNTMTLIDLTGAATSVKVEILGEVVHKIDPKFLPSGGIYTVVFNTDADFNITTNYSYAEVRAKALDANTVVRGVLQIVGYNGEILGNLVFEFVNGGDNYLEFRWIQLDENNFSVHTITLMEDGLCVYGTLDMVSMLR